MSHLRTSLISVLIFSFIGCSKNKETNPGTANVNNVKVYPKKHWWTPWRKSREQLKEEEKERAKLIAEKKEKLTKDLATADQLLDKWVAKLIEGKTNGNGFIHHDGLTELDPWGNLIKVDYEQINLKEWLIVQSFGPDGKEDTNDDLIKREYTMNYAGVLEGLDNTGKLVLFGICALFIFTVFLKVFLSRRKRKI